MTMKNVKYTVAAIVLSTLSFGAFAAQPVTDNDQHGQKIGVVSASGAYTLTQLEDQLAAKADAQGASAYKITSASGENLLHGTAVIYK
jgi:multiple stress resistance protein BhsA